MDSVLARFERLPKSQELPLENNAGAESTIKAEFPA